MNNISEIGKRVSLQHNLVLRVLDSRTGEVLQEHEGHNCATDSMLYGIGRYLVGDGVLNQGYNLLGSYVPKYISLGTMGLYSQDADADGLPTGIGGVDGDETARFESYMKHIPGYGADGSNPNENNGRTDMGLGKMFTTIPVNCELISNTYPRSSITYRDVLSETESELPQTIDVVFSAMVSTGALRQFRQSGKDYIFISEVGMWSTKVYTESGDNGLLAAYRIVPPNTGDWDMTIAENRQKLKEQILRVGVNQVVQVIWKIQLGSIDQLVGESGNNIYYPIILPEPNTSTTQEGEE